MAAGWLGEGVRRERESVTMASVCVCRMGLEALVESYAFWRPSLRTLTFEDIPGMAKQGRFLSFSSPHLPARLSIFDEVSVEKKKVSSMNTKCTH